jgi:hypothetical protein
MIMRVGRLIVGNEIIFSYLGDFGNASGLVLIM